MRGPNVFPTAEDLVKEIERLRKEARGTPPGIARDRLLRQTKQAEAALRMSKCASPRGLQHPEGSRDRGRERTDPV